MAKAYLTPGVYPEEIFLKPEAMLPTGVAGFAGYALVNTLGEDKKEVKPASPLVLHHPEDFNLYFAGNKDSFLAEAIAGFFRNGGVRCYVAFAEDKGIDKLKAAIESFASFTDIDILAAPDLPTDENKRIEFQRWLLTHCERLGDRIAILDLDQGISKSLSKYPSLLTVNQTSSARYGALYFPWLKVKAADGSDKVIPPCGHVAGIIARSDAKTGVFKAPANEEIMGVFDLEFDVSNTDQAELNSLGVNCLRAFSGRGIRVWGARTLSIEPEWRYVNVQRLFITLQRWLEAKMEWVVFEPNTLSLRVQIRRELNGYLHGLWLRGALQGNTPDQAFFVKCDEENNPSGYPDGQIISEIGLAPTVPAEFVVIRIVHRQPLIGEAGSL
jgi:uncharacterized protein